MSSEIKKNGYGFIDDTDASLRTKQGGKFGLNAGAFLTKFELNPKSGKDGADGDALDVSVLVGEKDFNMKIYPTTKVYDKKNNELTDVNSKEYVDAFNADIQQKNAVILHLLKSVGVTEQQIRGAFAAPVDSFADFINGLVALLPADFKSKPIDIFLEYQWNISEGQDRTFLQLPKNMKGGYFACMAQPGVWTEEKAEGKLIYRNQNGAIHPFERDKNFMEGNKANQQIEGQDSGSDALAAAAGMAAGNGTAKTGTW